MDWTVLIGGKQVPNEMDLRVDLKRNKPKKGELHPFKTSQGLFLFRVEAIEDVPRKAHVVLVSRVRRILPEYQRRYREAARRYNQMLTGQLPGVVMASCRTCTEKRLTILDQHSLCPHCGIIS